MEITITIKMDESELKNSKSEQKETIRETKVVASQYSRFYDETCSTYHENPVYNLMFLKQSQLYANDLLRAKGYLFLNEVYDILGMAKTKTGQLVGWIYDEKNPIGDNFVDFGIGGKCSNQSLMEGQKSILLDFNVDGFILDKIQKMEL